MLRTSLRSNTMSSDPPLKLAYAGVWTFWRTARRRPRGTAFTRLLLADAWVPRGSMWLMDPSIITLIVLERKAFRWYSEVHLGERVRDEPGNWIRLLLNRPFALHGTLVRQPGHGGDHHAG